MTAAPCSVCGGKGTVWPRRSGYAPAPVRAVPVTCERCRGTGRASATNRGTSARAARAAACEVLAADLAAGLVPLGEASPASLAAVRAWASDPSAEVPAGLAAQLVAHEAAAAVLVALDARIGELSELPPLPPELAAARPDVAHRYALTARHVAELARWGTRPAVAGDERGPRPGPTVAHPPPPDSHTAPPRQAAHVGPRAGARAVPAAVPPTERPPRS